MTGLTAQPPGSRRLRILLVDDEEVDRLAVRRSLGQSGLAATVDEAATSVETLARIGSADFDCLLLDYYLPGVDSLALLRRIREIAPNLPVVIFTGRGDEEIAVELMKAGAVDYLPKASLTPERLASSLRHALELAEAAVARRRAEDERLLLMTRAEAARAEAEAALQSRDAFFASITHDLRNPLATVKGYAQLLKRRLTRCSPPAESWLIEGLDQIESEANKTTVLLEELLDLARHQHTGRLELQLETFDLLDLCRAVVEERRHGDSSHHLELLSSVPELVGSWDRARMERVLVNVIGNAVKYSPNGGAVLVRLDREVGPDGPEVVLSVQDFGLGIPAADLPRIFDRFRRGGNVERRIGGTGMGLASVRQIVQAHGGTVTVESQENVGSTFKIRVPLRPPRSA